MAALAGSDVRFEGPIVRSDTRELNLLSRMVAERLDGHLETLFGLLAILFPPDDVWAAYRSLTSRRRALRVHALEYLDNTLTGELRQNVFAVIDDRPLDEKLRAAARAFDLARPTRTESVQRLISGDADAAAVGLAMAALHTVFAELMADVTYLDRCIRLLRRWEMTWREPRSRTSCRTSCPRFTHRER